MSEIQNTLPQIREFLGCEGRPVGVTEFKDFWMSCTDEEKNYYKSAPLVMGAKA